MAVQEHRIVISVGNATSGNNEVEQADTGLNDNEKLTSKEVALYTGLAIKMVSAATNELISWTMYDINKQLDLNDDYIGQRNLQIAQTLISKGGSIVMQAVSGAITGATFGGGVPGAIIGAVVGAGIGIAHQAIETTKSMEQQEIRLRQMDAQLDFQRQRAGWSLKAASIGEDL